jgi:hypothetical protein
VQTQGRARIELIAIGGKGQGHFGGGLPVQGNQAHGAFYTLSQ